MNEMLKQFNLPNFIDGLSFADASKKIQSRFKERTDPESIATEKEMLGRLKQMQEHIKEQQQAKEAEQNPPQEGDMMAEDPNQMGQPMEEAPQEEMPQEEFALGGEEEYDPHAMPDTAEQRFAPTIGANNISITDSITSLGKTASTAVAASESDDTENEKAFGGPDDEFYKANNPYFMQNPGPVDNAREQGISPAMAQDLSAKVGGGVSPSASSITDAASKGPGVAGYAGMATTAIDLGQEAFGPTGVDTSGRAHVEKKKAGNAALAGAAKGASAGMVLGPWGAAAGAVIGGAAGFIGAKKQQKDAAIANRNATYADAAVNDNQFAFGGIEGPFGSQPKSVADTLMASARTSAKAKVKPAMNFDQLDKEYKDFRSAKMDTISRNNQIRPSGKYVKLSGGRNKLAEVDTALIDAVESAEKRAGLKRGDLGATINREANYGGQYGKGMNYGKEIKAMGSTIDLLSMSNNYKGNDKYTGSEPLRHFADLKAPGVTTTKDFHGQYYQVTDKKLLDEYIRKNPQAVAAYNKKLHSGPTVGKKNSLDFLADDMKATGNTQKYRKQYNPGDKNYANLMEQDAKDLQNEKAYNKYLDTNKFAMGGEEMNRFDGGGDEDKAQAARAKVVAKANKGKAVAKVAPRTPLEAIFAMTPKEMVDKKTIFTGDKDADRDLLTNYTKENKLGKIDVSNLSRKKAAPITNLQRLKLAGMDVKEAVGNNKDMLRYAPALGNMMQLAKLQKPEQETTPELNARYKKNVVDEKGLVNLVREETSANREAILGSSEGSGNAARANLLGTQLNSTKALSDAFMKVSEANARENNQEQTFNLGVDTTNLQQQTLAQDIRARNKGAYDTEKSRLQTAIGADLGGIGQEELYKKFPELMGASYDWKGKYKKLKEEVDTKTSKAA
jgi:hypothetical protein